MIENVNPPVNVGDVIRGVKCEAIGVKGDGIFKFEKFVIICPDVDLKGTYDLRITKVLPRLAFAEKA